MKQKGITLIEVLITILIMGFGLLGVAQMQITSLKAVSKGSDTSEAILLANFIMDRIKTMPPPSSSNPVSISDYDTGNSPLGSEGPHSVDITTGEQTSSPSKTSCTETYPCSLAERVTVDLWQWDGMLQGIGEKIEKGSGNYLNTGGLDAANGCVDVINNQITVTVGWCALGEASQLDLNDSETCISSQLRTDILAEERLCNRKQISLLSIM